MPSHPALRVVAAAVSGSAFAGPFSCGLGLSPLAPSAAVEDADTAQAMRPGAVMAYRQHDAEPRKLVIAYLETLTEPK